jgi:hypothetical protein
MKGLFKDKEIIVSTTDHEIDFIIIVGNKDRAITSAIIEHRKARFYQGNSDYEMLSDDVFYTLEETDIDFLMPNFTEV